MLDNDELCRRLEQIRDLTHQAKEQMRELREMFEAETAKRIDRIKAKVEWKERV